MLKNREYGRIAAETEAVAEMLGSSVIRELTDDEVALVSGGNEAAGPVGGSR